jgi:mRNA-degrading endonuclease RelE of RelBE toxin-antitoxin system
MSYSVKTISVFERQAKRLMKKYPSLKKEIIFLISELTDNPTKGTSIANNCYKIRLAIGSKTRGKSGGARIITHFVFKDATVFLLSIYDKSEITTLPNEDILDLLKLIP